MTDFCHHCDRRMFSCICDESYEEKRERERKEREEKKRSDREDTPGAWRTLIW